MTKLTENILLGVTGSIAAYKSAELIRLLTKAGASVKVVMTQAAQQFITPLTLQTLSGNSVYCDQWRDEVNNPMLHIELARWANRILIAPASADFIARLTYGHADDLLTSVCLATTSRIILAPAMNQQMWHNPITQHNIQQLRARQFQLIDPEAGEQACGEVGPGRMTEPENIVKQLTPSAALNIKVMITAGPTQEAIDPVRYISNHSSGKMGYALAQAFTQAGAQVILVSGPCQIAPPAVHQLIAVKSAEQMHQAVMDNVTECQIFIGTAAVADYRVANPQHNKLKKSADTMQLSLIKNPDILSAITALPKPPYTVGFAAETENLLEHASKKLRDKKADMIIANLIHADGPFHSDDNEVTILQKDREPLAVPKQSKRELAAQIANLVLGNASTCALIPA